MRIKNYRIYDDGLAITDYGQLGDEFDITGTARIVGIEERVDEVLTVRTRDEPGGLQTVPAESVATVQLNVRRFAFRLHHNLALALLKKHGLTDEFEQAVRALEDEGVA